MALPFDLNKLKGNWYVNALFRQVVTVYEATPGNPIPVKRGVTIADFKTSDKSVSFEWRRGRDSLTFDRQIVDESTFAKAFRAAVDNLPQEVSKTCNVPGMPETYGTVMWFLDPLDTPFNYSLIKDTAEFDNPQGLGTPIGYDFGIDIDSDENSWMSGPHNYEVVSDFASFISEKLGVRVEVLVSKGVQVRATLLDVQLSLYEVYGLKWVNFVWGDIYNAHRALARRLVDMYGKVPIRIDEKFYDRARVTRLSFSLHGGIRGFSLPFSPRQLESLKQTEVSRRHTDINYVRPIEMDYM